MENAGHNDDWSLPGEFTMADGSVPFIAKDINMITFSALGTKNGNEVFRSL